MSSGSSPNAAKAEAALVRRFLKQESRPLRSALLAAVAPGLLAVACGIAQAWLIASLLANLLGLPSMLSGGAAWRGLGAVLLLTLGQIALGLWQEQAQRQLGERARASLRRRVFSALLRRGPADDRPVGEKAALVVDQVEALDGYFSRWMPAGFLAWSGPLLVALAAACVDVRSGIVLAIAGVLVPVGMAAAGIGAARASREQFDALSRLSGRFLDRMRGLPVLVLFNRQEDEAAALGAAASELRVRTLRVLRLAFLSSSTLELLSAGSLALLAWQHGNLFSNQAQNASAVTAIFVLLLVPSFFAPLRAFSAAYHERQSAAGAAAALAPLLAEEDALAQDSEARVLEEVPPKLSVTINDVTLRYDEARAPALQGLSFTAAPGETVVLAGPSGAGKSSVLRLLMGFHRPGSGQILMNGRDIAHLRPEEMRRLSSYVGQRSHIFRGTIAENIRFARPDADDAALRQAAKAAGVMAFAEDLPRGLDTLVGEGGFGLSGGQAQRVAVARAFLRNAPLLLLDEPTAHLDPATEAALLESLRQLSLGRTTLMVTHSREAQTVLSHGPGGRILWIDEGRVSRRERAVGGV